MDSDLNGRTHNPLVGGSNPPGATTESTTYNLAASSSTIDCADLWQFISTIMHAEAERVVSLCEECINRIAALPFP